MQKPSRLFDAADLALIEIGAKEGMEAGYACRLLDRFVNEVRWYQAECRRLELRLRLAEDP